MTENSSCKILSSLKKILFLVSCYGSIVAGALILLNLGLYGIAHLQIKIAHDIEIPPAPITASGEAEVNP
jgi:hypothetical protein